MADDMKPDPQTSLYETDFYAWTQQQAELIRLEHKTSGVYPIDWLRIAEEIEDLGREQLHKAESLTERIIQHLFKLAWTRNDAPVRGWRKEIRAWRPQLRRVLKRNPKVTSDLLAELESLHGDALEAILEDFRIDEPAARIDTSLRWTLEQILGEADDPLDA
jgi:predicted ATPase